MNVIYSGTRNLYPAMQGAIASLIAFNPDVKVYVLTEDDELPFQIPVEHEIINMSGQTYFRPDGPNMRNQFTYMAMLRACTADILRDVDRVIQLDVDTIVCDSLAPLWETDLTGKWLGWCPEQFGVYNPFGKTYYNFGVAVMNLDQMRADRVPQLLAELLNSMEFRFIDQDAMNLCAVPDRCTDIPVRFNECFCCGYTDRPAIIHYAGFPDWYESRSVPRWEWKEIWKAYSM